MELCNNNKRVDDNNKSAAVASASCRRAKVGLFSPARVCSNNLPTQSIELNQRINAAAS